MEYSRSIIEIIKERSSRRSYTPQPVEADKLGALSDFFAALKGPFGEETRFGILDTNGWGEGRINALGTYGTIQGARLFIVGIIRRGEHEMEDFGYQFDKLIKAVDLQRLDMGIAMSHFELTTRELGLGGRWEKMPSRLSPFPKEPNMSGAGLGCKLVEAYE